MGSVIFESFITWVWSWTVQRKVKIRSSDIECVIDFLNQTRKRRPHVTSNEKFLNITQFSETQSEKLKFMVTV